MALFKCKMCGGALEIDNNATVATCEYCGTQQTLPKLDDDRRANLYDRANHFRRNNEFDKAMGIYEQILNEDNTDAEAYWSLVLCRYGIEYVEDPSSHKRVPTVTRAQFTSIFDDEDYKSALNNADSYQKAIYETEAKAINEIQKGILAISQNEEPFDVFICYKETDASGRRTPDSVLANDLYHQLTQEGFKVFFARITLEDKLGSAYEPYIFAALNSAKVMVVLGTKPEFFNAAWVKNEWSRYLALIKQGQKKMLIPAYKDMDPYDLPEEFSHLQAQDMSKLGFMQDLIRGIKKIADVQEPQTAVAKETGTVGTSMGNANIEPLLERAFMLLEDKKWDAANEQFDKVLDVDPRCAIAHLGKSMVETRIDGFERAKKRLSVYTCNNKNFERALKYGDENFKNEYITPLYNRAVEMMNAARNERDLKKAALEFKAMKGFKDAEELALACENNANDMVFAKAYKLAVEAMNKADTQKLFNDAAEKFLEIKEYKDAAEMADLCFEKGRQTEYDDCVSKLKNANDIDLLSAIGKRLEALGSYKDAEELAQECLEKIDIIEENEEIECVEDAIVLLQELIDLCGDSTASNLSNTKKNIAELTATLEALNGVEVNWENHQKELEKLDSETESIKTKISELEQELSGLGLFQGKRKKQIGAELETLREKIAELDKNKKAYIEKLYGCSNDKQLKSLVDATEEKLAAANEKLKEFSKLRTPDVIRAELGEFEKSDFIGSTIKFGKFEQEDDETKDDLEWFILDVKGDKMLLMSKPILAVMPYNTSMQVFGWEKSSLRKWLNKDFYNSAFSKKERTIIAETDTFVDEDYFCHFTNNYIKNYPNNKTKDYVFFPTVWEAKSLIGSYTYEGKLTWTARNDKDGEDVRPEKFWWWLRSPALSTINNAPCVNATGSVNEAGKGVIIPGGVRPFIWIDLNKI